MREYIPSDFSLNLYEINWSVEDSIKLKISGKKICIWMSIRKKIGNVKIDWFIWMAGLNCISEK